MTEEIEQEKQEEEEVLTCPECGKGFQDMRGLTSHARHIHQMNKDELMKIKNNDSESRVLKIVGGVGLTILTILTLGKIQ